jgi:Helix-turn-helix domain
MIRHIHTGGASEPRCPARKVKENGISRDLSNAPRRAIKVLGQTDLISTKQVADIFGVTERTVRRWLASGKLPQRVEWSVARRNSLKKILRQNSTLILSNSSHLRKHRSCWGGVGERFCVGSPLERCRLGLGAETSGSSDTLIFFGFANKLWRSNSRTVSCGLLGHWK